MVAFRVRDSGVGIPAEFIGSIFEPFTQVDRTLARSHGGLGIGLTLVRKLVEMQNGTVSPSSSFTTPATGEGGRPIVLGSVSDLSAVPFWLEASL